MIIGNLAMIDTDKSLTTLEYKKSMKQIMRMYNPYISESEMNNILDFSIAKRYKESTCVLDNNYTNKKKNKTLLMMSDYIMKKEPILTAHGTLFKKHADCPNPLGMVIQQFLDQRSQYKKMMFRFPKGSEDYEKYNLLQQLSKIDANGIGLSMV